MTEGYLIYKDINVILGPVFYLIYVVFMKVFGVNYFAGDIYGGVQCGITAVLMYLLTRKLNKSNNQMITLTMILVSFYFSLATLYVNYNATLLHLIMLALLLEFQMLQSEEKWYHHFLIGIILGIGFFTKQTVGGIALISMVVFPIIHDWWMLKKNPMEKVLLRIAGAITVMIIACGIMVWRGNFIEYLNLCFGGIFEFGQKNTAMMRSILYPSLMLGILIGTFAILPKLSNKDEVLAVIVYEIACLAYIIPIGNSYHFSMAMFLIWLLTIPLIETIYQDNHQSIVNLALVILMISQIFFMYAGSKNSTFEETIVGTATYMANVYSQFVIGVSLCAWAWALVKNRPVFLKTIYVFCSIFSIFVFLFFYRCGVLENPDFKGFPIYANHGFYESDLEDIKNVVEYVKQKESEGYHTLLVSANVAKYTTAMNRNQRQYDLCFSGNMGYQGTQKVLDEIQTMHHTLILKEKATFWQEPQVVMDYIENHLKIYEELDNLIVYIKE